MSLSTTTAGRLLVVLAAALALALVATTAPIGLPGAPPPAVALELEFDSGVLTEGDAEVAKAFNFCRYTTGKPKVVEWERKEGSPGLGLPDPEGEKKNAWWGITADVVSTVKGAGELQACGFLTAMVDEAGVQLGAACGASKGWNGIGTILWNNGGVKTVGQDKANGVTQLEDIGWKVSVGGTLPVTANMVDPKDKDEKIGFLEATVQAFGGLPCTEKGPGQPEKGDPKDGGEQGATSFEVIGVYEAVRHHGKAPQPEELKKDDSEKKEPHRK